MKKAQNIHTSPPPEEPRDRDAFGLGSRAFLLSVTWVTALFVTAPDVRAIEEIGFFPFGLPLLRSFLDRLHETFLPLVLGWLLYGVLSAGVVFSTKRLWSFTFYAVLTILLITNVVGCREILNDVSKP